MFQSLIVISSITGPFFMLGVSTTDIAESRS